MRLYMMVVVSLLGILGCCSADLLIIASNNEICDLYSSCTTCVNDRRCGYCSDDICRAANSTCQYQSSCKSISDDVDAVPSAVVAGMIFASAIAILVFLLIATWLLVSQIRNRSPFVHPQASEGQFVER